MIRLKQTCSTLLSTKELENHANKNIDYDQALVFLTYNSLITRLNKSCGTLENIYSRSSLMFSNQITNKQNLGLIETKPNISLLKHCLRI